MSEYQYHEWQAVDRVLTSEEQAAVNDLSSHIEVSSSRAVVTYEWSDFRHDPRQVLLKYFDAYFYLANWGSLRLMFRFPKGLLDEATALMEQPFSARPEADKWAAQPANYPGRKIQTPAGSPRARCSCLTPGWRARIRLAADR